MTFGDWRTHANAPYWAYVASTSRGVNRNPNHSSDFDAMICMHAVSGVGHAALGQLPPDTGDILFIPMRAMVDNRKAIIRSAPGVGAGTIALDFPEQQWVHPVHGAGQRAAAPSFPIRGQAAHSLARQTYRGASAALRGKTLPVCPTVMLTIEHVSQAAAAQAQAVAAAAGVAAQLPGATGVSVHAAAVVAFAALAPAPLSAQAQAVVTAALAASVGRPADANWAWDAAVDCADDSRRAADSRRRYNDPAIAYPQRSTHRTSDWARQYLVPLGADLAARMQPFRQ